MHPVEYKQMKHLFWFFLLKPCLRSSSFQFSSMFTSPGPGTQEAWRVAGPTCLLTTWRRFRERERCPSRSSQCFLCCNLPSSCNGYNSLARSIQLSVLTTAHGREVSLKNTRNPALPLCHYSHPAQMMGISEFVLFFSLILPSQHTHTYLIHALV